MENDAVQIVKKYADFFELNQKQGQQMMLHFEKHQLNHEFSKLEGVNLDSLIQDSKYSNITIASKNGKQPHLSFKNGEMTIFMTISAASKVHGQFSFNVETKVEKQENSIKKFIPILITSVHVYDPSESEMQSELEVYALS